jgi:hypothetical protein
VSSWPAEKVFDLVITDIPFGVLDKEHDKAPDISRLLKVLAPRVTERGKGQHV